jgi:hypothetical protein
MTNKENAQRIIRYLQSNVNFLKELTFGCKMIYKNELVTFLGSFEGEITVYRQGTGFQTFRISPNGLFPSLEMYNIEIIGHEPELRHLLLAIDKVCPPNELQCLSVCTSGDILNQAMVNQNTGLVYDLTKSLKENLIQNTDLCKFLYQLLIQNHE